MELKVDHITATDRFGWSLTMTYLCCECFFSGPHRFLFLLPYVTMSFNFRCQDQNLYTSQGHCNFAKKTRQPEVRKWHSPFFFFFFLEMNQVTRIFFSLRKNVFINQMKISVIPSFWETFFCFH